MDESVHKFSLVVRKPQEGKTSICIASIIKDISEHPNNIHVIFTMNTIISSMQFFDRIKQEPKPDEDSETEKKEIIDMNNVVLFNCKKMEDVKSKHKHAKKSYDVLNYIQESNSQVIVCCANKNKFEGILSILDKLSDSIKFIERNRNIVVHIDEAHIYIPYYREIVRKLYANDFVSNIIGYTASPDPIYTSDEGDNMFHKIYIIDPEKEYEIIRSKKYFGVKDCKVDIIDIDEQSLINKHGDEIGHKISNDVIQLSLSKQQRTKYNNGQSDVNNNVWFDSKFRYNAGNEKLLLCFLMEIIPTLVDNPNVFSYHFVPGYLRKVTHYKIADIIFTHYPDANVICINGNGIQLLRNSSGKSQVVKVHDNYNVQNIQSNNGEKEKEKEEENKYEPANIIFKLIEKEYENYPTFVTGYLSVGMSVTLINNKIKNFDSTVMCHTHCLREDLYQLCRFTFKYDIWSEIEIAEMKKTRFVCYTRKAYDICLDYEKHVDELSNDYKDQFYKLTSNDDKMKKTGKQNEYKSERKRDLDSLEGVVDIYKEFEIDTEIDGVEENKLKEAKAYYEQESGEKIKKVSEYKIDKNDPRFKVCSTTSKIKRHTYEEIKKIVTKTDKKSWHVMLMLVANKFKYVSRMLVGYKDINDPTKYTILIRTVTLPETDKVKQILNKYHGTK